MSRLLVDMICDASTSKFASMFPYPLILLRMAKEEDEILDLNQLAYKAQKNKKYEILNEALDDINSDEFDSVVINVGNYAPDGYFVEQYVKHLFPQITRPFKIIGPATITQPHIFEPYPLGEVTDYQKDVHDIIIPIEMLKVYPKVDDKMKANVKASTGCPRRCNMCPVPIIYDGKYKYHNVDKTIARIVTYHALGVKFINFVDDNLGGNQKKFLELLQGLKKANLKGMKYCCQEGFEVLDLLNEDICQLLKELNFVDIRVGVENIEPSFLERINKYYTDHEMVTQLINNCKKYDLDVKFFLLLAGFQSKEDAIGNIKYFVEQGVDVRCNILRHYEGATAQTEVLTSDAELRSLKALAYSAVFMKRTLGLDVFTAGEKELEEAGYVMQERTDGIIRFLEGRQSFGFKTSRFTKGMEFILGRIYNAEVKAKTSKKEGLTFTIQQMKIKKQLTL